MGDWDGGMSANGRPRVQLFAGVSIRWPHSALGYSIIISCQSAAISEIVKPLLFSGRFLCGAL